MHGTAMFNGYLPDVIKTYIEENFYARVNRQAILDQLIQNLEFVRNPLEHTGLFSDHGVVHVRDVTVQVFQVLDTINGVLIPKRSRSRLDLFMKGYGEIVAYLHDIGMADFSPFSRSMHPEFAAQWVFSHEFDPLMEILWEENTGNIAWRLLNLAHRGVLKQDPQITLREMLAMSTCHSKSKVPVDVLNDPVRLRSLMQEAVSTDLSMLYWQQEVQRAEAALEAAQEAQAPDTTLQALQGCVEEAKRARKIYKEHYSGSTILSTLERFYHDFPKESFTWLTDGHPDLCLLADDVIDTLRALRCADALRQRGTNLKTSGSYEIFVDQESGDAIIALRQGQEQLFLLRIRDAHRAGEANLASIELQRDGDLRLSFHRGRFANQQMVERAAYAAAFVINDIQSDVIDSFRRPADDLETELKSYQDILFLIESTDDNLQFAQIVAQQLQQINPALANQIVSVPSMQNVPLAEQKRYLGAGELNWDSSTKQEFLDKLEQTGHKTEDIDLNAGFEHVRQITLQVGETLIDAGSVAHFVYIPLEEGLRVVPLGGYTSFSVNAWMPLGVTGVVRGAIRNATVSADRDVKLIAIPKEVYLRYWHHPYSIEELFQKLNVELPAPE